jgi:UDP-glucose:(heptosyl)LPS alpha-1,3-glucosyltransferase
MRLALIRQRAAPFTGGERFHEDALEALLERNVAITLYSRDWPQTRLQLIEPKTVDPSYAGRWWRDAGFAREVTREIGSAKADLVVSHDRVVCCDVYCANDGVHAARLDEWRRGATLGQRLRLAASPWHRYLVAAERAMYASPWLRAVIVGSAMVRDEVVERYGLPASRVHVIPRCVDSEAFHPGLARHRDAVRARLGIPGDALLFLLAGSGFERLGVAATIEALAELPSYTHLLVAGRDRREERYRALAQQYGVAGRVTFAADEPDLKPLYGAADVLVLPTVYDPCPDVALEAMACGLPVITSTKCGIAELVLAHDCGLVCPARDVPGLAAQMRALTDEATRARLAARARGAVLPLSPAALTLKLVLLYKDLFEEAAERAKQDAARRSARAAAAAAAVAAAAAGVEAARAAEAVAAADDARAEDATGTAGGGAGTGVAPDLAGRSPERGAVAAGTEPASAPGEPPAADGTGADPAQPAPGGDAAASPPADPPR